jgi:hypothetical protein
VVGDSAGIETSSRWDTCGHRMDIVQSSDIAAMLHMGLCTVPAYHNYDTVVLPGH